MARSNIKLDDLRPDQPLLHHRHALAQIFSDSAAAHRQHPVQLVFPDSSVLVAFIARPIKNAWFNHTRTEDVGEDEIERALDRVAHGQVVVHASPTRGPNVSRSLRRSVFSLISCLLLQILFVGTVFFGYEVYPFGATLGDPESTRTAQNVLYTITLLTHIMPVASYVFDFPWLICMYSSAMLPLMTVTLAMCLSSFLDIMIIGTMFGTWLISSDIAKDKVSHVFKIEGRQAIDQ
eukprot:Selendium_serpulae@DN5276_c0_g1_i3.p1